VKYMGCDIHLIIEVKNNEGKWKSLEISQDLMPDDRDYRLFSFLCDVRSYDSWELAGRIAWRGIPKDCSSKAYFSDLDIHSCTYAHLDEVLELPWKDALLGESYFFIFFKYILPRLMKGRLYLSYEEKRNIRVIIGFDN